MRAFSYLLELHLLTIQVPRSLFHLLYRELPVYLQHYAEFATIIPVAGSVYTYVTLGEIWAWIMDGLILEYFVIVAAVAIGWPNYFVEIFSSVGIILPGASVNPHGINAGIINLPAVLIVFLIMSLLITGVRESSHFNTAIVLIKLAVLTLFIAIEIYHINHSNTIHFPICIYGSV